MNYKNCLFRSFSEVGSNEEREESKAIEEKKDSDDFKEAKEDNDDRKEKTESSNKLIVLHYLPSVILVTRNSKLLVCVTYHSFARMTVSRPPIEIN